MNLGLWDRYDYVSKTVDTRIEEYDASSLLTKACASNVTRRPLDSMAPSRAVGL